MTRNKELERKWALGWQTDCEYRILRIIYHKKTYTGESTCYIYRENDLLEHVFSKCLTNLEYIEGRVFWKEHNNNRIKEK